jgi:hypothetical protein
MNLKNELLRIAQLSKKIIGEGSFKMTIISEDKKDDLLKQYGEDYEWLIDYLYDEDPSPSKKYVNWMVKTYLNNESIDQTNMAGMIQYFDKNQHKFQKKDIYQYTYDELVRAYEQALTKISKREISSAGVEKLYEDERYVLVRPKNEEASCKYGANTKWCIASRMNNYFYSYSDENLFFFIIDKLRQPIEGKKKSSNYFKIAVQYSPNKELSWDHGGVSDFSKQMFLKQSQKGVIQYWNSVDENITKKTVEKYLPDQLLRTFIDLIKKHTYQVYLNYYEKQLAEKQKFDYDYFKKLKKSLNTKKKNFKIFSDKYFSNPSVIFVYQTNDLYETFVHFMKSIQMEPKTFDELLEFKKIKERYYKEKKIQTDLQTQLNDLSEDVKRTQKEYDELLKIAKSLELNIEFR